MTESTEERIDRVRAEIEAEIAAGAGPGAMDDGCRARTLVHVGQRVAEIVGEPVMVMWDGDSLTIQRVIDRSRIEI